MEKWWKQWQFFGVWGKGGSKITVDSDCSHDIERYLLFGRKAMTNLDSILKSRDITLPTNVHIIQAMVFPIVMYRCESWTINKTEHWRIDAFELWCWRRLLRIHWTARKSNQSILKEINPEYLLGGLMLKLRFQYFSHLMWRADSLEKTLMLGKTEGRKRRGQQRMVGWPHQLYGHEFDQALGDGEGQGSLVCCSLWDHKELDRTEDWTTACHTLSYLHASPICSLCLWWLPFYQLNSEHCHLFKF